MCDGCTYEGVYVSGCMLMIECAMMLVCVVSEHV